MFRFLWVHPGRYIVWYLLDRECRLINFMIGEVFGKSNAHSHSIYRNVSKMIKTEKAV